MTTQHTITLKKRILKHPRGPFLNRIYEQLPKESVNSEPVEVRVIHPGGKVTKCLSQRKGSGITGQFVGERVETPIIGTQQ